MACYKDSFTLLLRSEHNKLSPRTADRENSCDELPIGQPVSEKNHDQQFSRVLVCDKLYV
jgi:hypothetical protein